MADESPMGSPLSELSSDAFEGDEEHDRFAAEALMPPAKRQKMGDSSLRATPMPHIDYDAISISTDTSGEVPSSPSNLRPEDEDTHEQVTVCAWMGCEAGYLGNMDRLVDHIHNEHIETRQKKYTCEWADCSRRSMPHASAYALKAHMRSHTREKPFYCALPECDRAFTRSDALAKHMRTVHETEALRPSDPIPKGMHPSNKNSRLKTAKNLQGPPGEQHGANGTTNGNYAPGWVSSFPAELGFTPEEEARGPHELWRLLRRQVHWAEEEGELLKRQSDAMEELRKNEWSEKEVLLEQVIRSEIDWHDRRQEVLAGLADLPTAEDIRAAAAVAASQGSPSPKPQPPSGKSADGQPLIQESDAAVALASLSEVGKAAPQGGRAWDSVSV